MYSLWFYLILLEISFFIPLAVRIVSIVINTNRTPVLNGGKTSWLYGCKDVFQNLFTLLPKWSLITVFVIHLIRVQWPSLIFLDVYSCTTILDGCVKTKINRDSSVANKNILEIPSVKMVILPLSYLVKGLPTYGLVIISTSLLIFKGWKVGNFWK